MAHDAIIDPILILSRNGIDYTHNMNGMVVSLDGVCLYINSGSGTDRGERQYGTGQFPGLRKIPTTSAMLKVPADSIKVCV